jgi:hypothetical protein
MKKPAAKGNLPMPRWLAEHPKLAGKFAELAEHVNFDALPAFEAIEVTKTLIRASAKIVQKSLYESDRQCPAVRMQCLLQLARAMGEGDAKGARRATKWMPDLARTFSTNNDTITITDNSGLENISRSIALKSIEEEKRLAKDGTKNGRPRGGRTAALQRQALLWSPFKRQFTNVGIIKADGSLASTGLDKSQEIARHWEKTFAAKPIDLQKAKEFARKFTVDFELGSVGPPSEDEVCEFFRKARHSAPGPDGLPYGAWKAPGKTGARATARGIEELMESEPAPADFNDSLGIFPAKGDADDDSKLMKRRQAEDTRPLSCKNTVNKGMAATVNRQMVDPIARNAHHSQEGFIKGRQGLNNVTTLDAASRVADLKAVTKKDPKLSLYALLDIAGLCGRVPEHRARLYLCDSWGGGSLHETDALSGSPLFQQPVLREFRRQTILPLLYREWHPPRMSAQRLSFRHCHRPVASYVGHRVPGGDHQSFCRRPGRRL